MAREFLDLPDKPRPWRALPAPLEGFYILDADQRLVSYHQDRRLVDRILEQANAEEATVDA